jgi:hypothetical protein
MAFVLAGELAPRQLPEFVVDVRQEAVQRSTFTRDPGANQAGHFARRAGRGGGWWANRIGRVHGLNRGEVSSPKIRCARTP